MPIGEIESVLEAKYVFPKLRPPAGGWPIPDFRPIIPREIFEKITAGCDRLKVESATKKVSSFSLIDNIRGGMVVPHMHVGEEIILFDKAAMKKYFQAVADLVDKIEDINDSKAYLRF
ncbi:MAG: hypothetical protein JXQ77_04305 [Campylobacterales bacterium]|nr:hypothetical protein [Campylobacterales bacterium]